MKKDFLLPFIIVVMASMMSPMITHAETSEYILYLHKQTNTNKDHNQTLDRDGQRAPVRPIVLYIYQNEGVSIPDVNKEEIISYSIYNDKGILESSFIDDVEFTSYIFSLSGVFNIVLNLKDYTLCGWMTL